MVWLTLKPKSEGCEEKSRWISVDLPVPEGPEKTMGRAVEGSIGGMLGVVREGWWGRMGWWVESWVAEDFRGKDVGKAWRGLSKEGGGLSMEDLFDQASSSVNVVMRYVLD